MSSRRLGLPLGLVLALSGALLPACGDGAGKPSGGAKGAPGIVLICLDTLRLDAVERMPALSAFAKTSTSFADASANASWTAPSVATILTGLVPSRHGVHGARGADPLPRGVVTLASMLMEAGWQTAASAAGAWVSRAMETARGFDAFDEGFDERDPEATVAAWKESRRPPAPFFLFLHTYAAHEPYGPKGKDPPADSPEWKAVGARVAAAAREIDPEPAPGALARLVEANLTERLFFRAAERALPAPLSTRLTSKYRAWVEGGFRDDPAGSATVLRLVGAYDRGLEEADRVFARTLAALDAAALPEGTVVAVVSDHGEAFGEHDVVGHGPTLHDEILRVPILVRAPGRLPAREVRGSCCLADVTPTLLDLAGVAAPNGLDGRSLLPLARGAEAGRPAFAEAERQFPERRDLPHEGPLASRSVRSEDAKYLVTFDPKTKRVVREEFFELSTDPAERNALPPETLTSRPETFLAEVRRARTGLVGAAPLPAR